MLDHLLLRTTPHTLDTALARRRHKALNRQTLRLLPGCKDHLEEQKRTISQLVRDHIETQHTPGTEWMGDLSISIETTSPRTQVQAWSSALHKKWDIPNSINATIHAILFANTHTYTPSQHLLWVRWIDTHATWRHNSPRYTAHDRLRAQARLSAPLPNT